MPRRLALLVAVCALMMATIGIIELTRSGDQEKVGINKSSSTLETPSSTSQDDAEEFQKAIIEFTQLRDDLASTQDQALQTPEVQKAFDQFQTILLNRMKEIDPEVDKKIERLDSLGRKLEELQERMGGPGGM